MHKCLFRIIGRLIRSILFEIKVQIIVLYIFLKQLWKGCADFFWAVTLGEYTRPQTVFQTAYVLGVEHKQTKRTRNAIQRIIYATIRAVLVAEIAILGGLTVEQIVIMIKADNPSDFIGGTIFFIGITIFMTLFSSIMLAEYKEEMEEWLEKED